MPWKWFFCQHCQEIPAMWWWAFHLQSWVVFLCHTLLNSEIQNLPILACPWTASTYSHAHKVSMFLSLDLNSACLRWRKQANLLPTKKRKAAFWGNRQAEEPCRIPDILRTREGALGCEVMVGSPEVLVSITRQRYCWLGESVTLAGRHPFRLDVWVIRSPARNSPTGLVFPGCPCSFAHHCL